VTLFAHGNPSVPVPFYAWRQMMLDTGGGLQPGVMGGADLKVTQRGAGANMSVDVSSGRGWVSADASGFAGLAHFTSDATANVAVTTANGTNPRIDQLLVRWNDSSVPVGSGGDTPTFQCLAGTATGGATLDNRTGAAALPTNSLRLADILVPAASSSVTNANIRDRRPWARGAFNRTVRNSNAAAGNDYTFTGATLALIDSTNLQPRIECSGVPLKVTVTGRILGNASGAHHAKVGVFVDGTGHDGMGTAEGAHRIHFAAASAENPVSLTDVFVPAAGSHLIGLALSTDLSTDFLRAQATVPLTFTVEEVVRNSANNT
jgi:hypothetical protein